MTDFLTPIRCAQNDNGGDGFFVRSIQGQHWPKSILLNVTVFIEIYFKRRVLDFIIGEYKNF